MTKQDPENETARRDSGGTESSRRTSRSQSCDGGETARDADVAALFVDPRGAYANVPGVDLWDEARDARLYDGPLPVVAHPPCSAWCQLASVNEKRYGHAIGDDGGCFASALDSVRTFGGVLEHPAETIAWIRFDLARPRHACWARTLCGGWVTEVEQGMYGHRARKRTWLYAHGVIPAELPRLRWGSSTPTATVSFCRNHGGGDLPRLSKREAKATPVEFRDVLLAMARSVRMEVRHAG